MKKIRLMQITHDLAIGGLQQVVVNICRSIDKDHFDISVLCLRELGDLTDEVRALGINVFHLEQKKGGVDYLSFLKVARILKQERIDVIHTHNTQPFVDGTTAALMSGVRTIVHTDHSRVYPDKIRYIFAEWLMSHFVYKVVAVSDSTAQDLIKYEKISPRKIITVPNGIDGSRFNISVDKIKKRKELGISGKGPVIGITARLVEQKGINYLIKAMPAVIDELPGTTLVVAGEGDYEEILKNEAKAAGVDGNILFLGPRLDIPELLPVFDAYVLPSIWEGLPMSLLEAMAAGCPIIATKVGGIPKLIEHGVNGSLVEPADPVHLAAEIIKLLKDPALRTAYSQKNLVLFKQKYEASIMTKRYEKLYLREG